MHRRLDGRLPEGARARAHGKRASAGKSVLDEDRFREERFLLRASGRM